MAHRGKAASNKRYRPLKDTEATISAAYVAERYAQARTLNLEFETPKPTKLGGDLTENCRQSYKLRTGKTAKYSDGQEATPAKTRRRPRYAAYDRAERPDFIVGQQPQREAVTPRPH